MKPSFNWQSEDQDDDWTEPPPVADKPFRRSYRPLFVTLGIVLLGLTTAVLYILHRQNETIERISQDVTAVFTTAQQAINRQDAELYAQLLSTQDRAWYTAQRRVFAAGLPLDRAPLGLQPVPTAVPIPVVNLSANLRQAELTFAMPYTAVADLGVAAPINLKQTAVYRQQNSRWLQTPPDDAFWGESAASDMGLLSLTYPTRDEAIVQRLGQDLAAELAGLCAELTGGDCPAYLRVSLEFSTDPASLTDLTDLNTPAWNGRSFLLPAPTLIGLPTDEMSYLALYRGLTRRIVHAVRAQLATPIPLPDQQVQTLCFAPNASGLRLYTYDLRQDTWQPILPETRFRSLTPLPGDDGVILHELPPTLGSTRLRLSYLQGNRLLKLLDETEMPGILRPVGWSSDRSRLILQGTDSATSAPFYRWLDVDACRAAGCTLQPLPGYPIWSPDGRYTILVAGSTLHLGDASGQIQQPLGDGFSPVWLDAERYAFIRFEQVEGRITAVVMVGRLGENAPQTLFTAATLSQLLSGGEETAVFPKYISLSPADPNLLVVAASGINDRAGRYYIFTYRLDGLLELRLEIDGAPQGNPAQRTPIGYPPYLVSPDGRWLVLSELHETWTFYLHNLARNETTVITTDAPAVPDRFPYFDWSADGRWLIIADNGFLRLLAPDHNYQRLIPHAFDACLHTAWVN